MDLKDVVRLRNDGLEIKGLWWGTQFVWPDPWMDLWDEGIAIDWQDEWRNAWTPPQIFQGVRQSDG